MSVFKSPSPCPHPPPPPTQPTLSPSNPAFLPLLHLARLLNSRPHAPPLSPPTMPPTPNNLAPALHTVPALPRTALPVSGRLPSYLQSGTLYRQGPGRFEVTHTDSKTSSIRHWFDGYALVHAFHLDADSNSVAYRSNFIAPGAIRAAEALPKQKYHPFLFSRSDPCYNVLGRLFQLWSPDPVDPHTGRESMNINVTLQDVPGKAGVVARTDFNLNGMLDEDKLEIDHFFRFGQVEGSKEGNGDMSAAHGQVDRERGEFWNYRYSIGGPRVTYKVFRVGSGGKEDIMGEVRDVPAYLHSFALTEQYVVLIVWPLLVGGLKLLWTRSFMDSMKFEKGRKARFHVFARDGRGLLATYESDPFFCFHTVNAFEKGDAVHIDLCRYDNAEVLDDFMLDKMRTSSNFKPTRLTRFSLEDMEEAVAGGPQVVRQARETVLNAESLELPRLNSLFHRKEYRYVYGVSDSNGMAFGAVAKVDVSDGSKRIWSLPGGVVGEPMFVADPQGVEEDDGVLLVVVMVEGGEKSCLVVVDAKSMEEVARATVPQVVPLGFHGNFKIKGTDV